MKVTCAVDKFRRGQLSLLVSSAPVAWPSGLFCPTVGLLSLSAPDRAAQWRSPQTLPMEARYGVGGVRVTDCRPTNRLWSVREVACLRERASRELPSSGWAARGFELTAPEGLLKFCFDSAVQRLSERQNFEDTPETRDMRLRKTLAEHRRQLDASWGKHRNIWSRKMPGIHGC